MIVGDKVCVGIVSTCSLFGDKNQSSLIDETGGSNWVSFGGSVFRQRRVLQGKPLRASAVFQCVPVKIVTILSVIFWDGDSWSPEEANKHLNPKEEIVLSWVQTPGE